MTRVRYYHLAFKGAVHIGERGIEQEETRHTLPADTLYAALVSAAASAGPPPEAWARAFAAPEEVPFLIGSAFPYAGGVRFYPLPMVDLKKRGIPAGEPKKIKRLAFVSEGVWRRLLRGEPLEDLFPAEGKAGQGACLQKGALWLTREEIAHLPEEIRTVRGPSGGRHPRPVEALYHINIYQEWRAPRVTVDRFQRGTSIFYTGRVSFARGCGLWFPVAWRQPEAPVEAGLTWRAAFERALTLLGDDGLGGDRAAGLGGFTWSLGGEEEWPEPTIGAPMALLSRYHPRPEEVPAALEGEAVRYRLTWVAGYLRSPGQAAQRRRGVRFVEEGSLLTACPQPMGDIVDVRPQVGEFPHPVWRYGLALGVEVRHG